MIAALFGDSTVRSQDRKNNCANTKDCLTEKIKAHPVRYLHYWKNISDKPLEQRIKLMPTEVVDYLKMGIADGKYSNNFYVPPLDATFVKDIKAALLEIPDAIREFVNYRLAAIYVVKNLESSGYCGWIYNDKSDVVAGFIVLDISILKNKKANEWYTWRENTPFIKDPHINIKATIEHGENDNRKNAIQFILLHEIAHLVGLRDEYLPFTDLSWTTKDGKNYSTHNDSKFPEREKISFYLNPALLAQQALKTYEDLEKTDFVTLYSSTDFDEDFAETFATYVHSVVLKKPYKVEIFEDGKTAKIFKLCWGEKRCAEKERFLRKLIKITSI